MMCTQIWGAQLEGMRQTEVEVCGNFRVLGARCLNTSGVKHLEGIALP